MGWATITSALDIAVEVDLCQVRLGLDLYELAAVGPASFDAVCRDTGETQRFELAEGGPLGYGVSTGSSGRAKLIAMAWLTICARAKRSPLPAAW